MRSEGEVRGVGVEEGAENVSDLLPAGVGRDGAGSDLTGREVPDELLQLGETGVVGVADPVVAPALTDRHQPVLPRRLQARHLGLGEVHGAGLDLADLQVSRLTGELLEQGLVD